MTGDPLQSNKKKKKRMGNSCKCDKRSEKEGKAKKKIFPGGRRREYERVNGRKVYPGGPGKTWFYFVYSQS